MKLLGLLACAALLALAHPAAAQSADIRPAAVLRLGERVADWQLARMHASDASRVTGETANPRGWEQGAFWAGMTRLADASGKPRFRDAILAQARANQWKLGERPYFADDHVIGQSYLWAARNGAGEAALAPMRAVFDRIIAEPAIVHLNFYFGAEGYGGAPCLRRWCWCDALFMSPPTLLGLARATGETRYRDFAIAEFWATTDFLYDPAERLYYRDSRFFERRDEAGRKQFWSRGNGWVFAGVANLLDELPADDPARARFEALFKDMAARLLTLQKEDGYWPPSLLAPEGSPPETSGTGFYTYGFAWGVAHGLLDRAAYEPAIRRGWSALARAVSREGRLGWVQQVSDRPEAVAETDTQYYGVGAFLLAASAIAALDLPRR